MNKAQDINDYFQRLMAKASDSREAIAIMREYQATMSGEIYGYGYPSIPPAMFSPVNPLLSGLGPLASNESASLKPKPPLPEEHIVAAITGYRAWNVPLFVDELRSVAKSHKWKPYQRFEAQCEASQCSGVACSCGIYAFNKMELVQKEYTTTDRNKRYVYGECWLWGRVLECKDGYRAQFAYPKAFINSGPIAERMAEVFGVELIGVTP
jgi:hypothetical protein